MIKREIQEPIEKIYNIAEDLVGIQEILEAFKEYDDEQPFYNGLYLVKKRLEVMSIELQEEADSIAREVDDGVQP